MAEGTTRNELTVPSELFETPPPDHQAATDAKFVAHIRQDIPDLLAELERLRDALRAAVQSGEQAQIELPYNTDGHNDAQNTAVRRILTRLTRDLRQALE